MDRQKNIRWLLLIWTAWIGAGTAAAHPVPKRAHDRTLLVRIEPAKIVVEYTLEVDEWTVVFEDLPAVRDTTDLAKLSKPADFYDAFTRSYAPILASNLVATLDGQ